MATQLLRTANAPQLPDQLFDLVNDIEEYPHFVPWCTGGQIIKASAETVEARLEFAKGPWRQSFTTLNQLQPKQRVQMHLIDGPFKFLEGTWTFASVGELTTLITLSLNFEFKNRLLGMAMNPIIQQMSTQVVQAFTQRANIVYGK